MAAKLDDPDATSGWVSLGEKFETYCYNLTVMPEKGPIQKFNFGAYPTIRLRKWYSFNGKTVFHDVNLTYAVGGEGLLDFDATWKRSVQSRPSVEPSTGVSAGYGCAKGNASAKVHAGRKRTGRSRNS